MLDNYNPFKTHLFIDHKEQVIYYDYQNKMGYYIPDDKINKYYVYSNRLLVAILAAVVLVNTFLSLESSIIVAVVLEIVIGFFFYKRFLPELRKNDKLSIDKLLPYKRTIEKKEGRSKQILKLVLYVVFSILLVINAFDQNMLETNIAVFYLSIGTSILVFFYVVYQMIRINK